MPTFLGLLIVVLLVIHMFVTSDNRWATLLYLLGCLAFTYAMWRLFHQFKVIP